MVKKEVLIVIAIVLVIVGFIIYKQVSKVDITYAIGKGNRSHENVLIENYEQLEKFIEDTKLNSTVEINFKKNTVTDVYNEEYFKNKKLAVITLYEDTSKNYIYSVDDLKYSGNEATITYTDKTEGYAGPLSNSWYNILLVEIKGNVNKVNFTKDNSDKK